MHTNILSYKKHTYIKNVKYKAYLNITLISVHSINSIFFLIEGILC